MNDEKPETRWRQITLIGLRTLIGWHFLYEGYYKLMTPGWSADGVRLAGWKSTGYLEAATGPPGRLFRWMLSHGWQTWIDGCVKYGLIAVGTSLMLGLLTRLGCWGALAMLALFYLAAVPLAGIPQAGAEGSYLIVNKTLIEAAAVCLLLAFDTGGIAGLDLLWRTPRRASLSQTSTS